MMMKRRTYVDGKLVKTGLANDVETARRYLDNIEREWSRDLAEVQLAPESWRGSNVGKEVTRISIDELLVTTTEDKKLRFVLVGVK